MTNDEIKKALGAAATIMRTVAGGKQIVGDSGFATVVGPNAAERLRHWAGQLELTRDELVNRKNWESIQKNGFES